MGNFQVQRHCSRSPCNTEEVCQVHNPNLVQHPAVPLWSFLTGIVTSATEMDCKMPEISCTASWRDSMSIGLRSSSNVSLNNIPSSGQDSLTLAQQSLCMDSSLPPEWIFFWPSQGIHYVVLLQLLLLQPFWLPYTSHMNPEYPAWALLNIIQFVCLPTFTLTTMADTSILLVRASCSCLSTVRV